MIVARSEYPLSDDIKAKIALFCDIDERAVIPNLDAETMYEVPLAFEAEGLDDIVIERLGLQEVAGEKDLSDWKAMVSGASPQAHCPGGYCRKYVFCDAYLMCEALRACRECLGGAGRNLWVI